MINVFSLILASYRQNILRSCLVFLALLVACAGLSAVLIINSTAKQSYAAAGQAFVENINHRIVPRSGKIITKTDYSRLRKAGYNQLIAVLKTRQTIFSADSVDAANVQFTGIDTFALLSLPDTSRATVAAKTREFPLTKLWQAPYQSIIHQDYAQELNLVDGQEILFDDGKILAHLAVLDINGLGREIVLDIAVLQQALGITQISEIFVVGSINDTQNDSLTALTTALPNHLRLESLNTGDQAQQLTASFHLNLLAMALLMFVVCMFVVMNALHLLLIKRWHNLRIARQLGVSRIQIYVALLLELFAISLICAPFGALCGALLAQFLSPQVSQTLQGLFEVKIAYVELSFSTLVFQCFIACLIGAMLAAILPLWQLKYRLALRGLPADAPSKNIRWLFSGLFLILIAAVAAPISSNLITSFSVIALLIFAGCCLVVYTIPMLMGLLYKTMSAKFVLLRWAFADSVRLSQSSKIACCAFFIAVASNIGMNLMVDSFRQATEFWLSQRLIADQYVRTQTPDIFTTWLADQNIQVDVIPRKFVETRIISKEQAPDQPIAKLQLRSYPTSDNYQKAMLFDRSQSDVWSRFTSGDGILVNQQLALKNDFQLGNILSFQLESGNIINKQVVGIYFDYGNQRPQALLPLAGFDQYQANTAVFALHFAKHLDNEQRRFNEALKQSAIAEKVLSLDTEELLALSMRTFDRTFIITESLNIVTLLVAALSLATSVLMIDMDNRPQRALIRTFGVGTLRLTSLSLLQYSVLTTFTCLLALPFGIGLSWLLINLLNIQAFHWSYPLLIEPFKLISVCITSLVLVLSVLILPLYRLNRRTLAEDIKCLIS
ncbi:MAG: putative ABC transport system permease protein [Paraglaciecola sp.]|jgi:putative ABC transport system permease protein